MVISSTQSREEQQHSCLPRPTRPCPMCGESLPVATYCEICGEDVTVKHVCAPHPLAHVCSPAGTRGTCLACGQYFPAARFCVTCGADITPTHQCSAAPATTVRRADPVHRCPAHELKHCPSCDGLMPAMVFCEHCGVNITAAHVCAQKQDVHSCSPLVTMPHRCAKCGEIMPASQHCVQCGADTTQRHMCDY